MNITTWTCGHNVHVSSLTAQVDPCACVCVFLKQVSLTRSPPVRSGDAQGEGLLLSSYDRTLVVKQISSEDVADMHNILSEYHQVGLAQTDTSRRNSSAVTPESVSDM